jgi:two-component system, NarL family, nitrate/nitrite sensor histidine kinase NarX
LDRTLDQILELTRADIGSIHFVEPNRERLSLILTRGALKDFIYAEECIPLREYICGETACTGRLFSSPDLAVEPRLDRFACLDERFGSLVSIPLKSQARILGVFTIYAKRPNAFSGIDEDFLILLGHHLGVSIENTQLYARTRELAITEERGLIAQEIHDGIAQSLTYLNLETNELQVL